VYFEEVNMRKKNEKDNLEVINNQALWAGLFPLYLRLRLFPEIAPLSPQFDAAGRSQPAIFVDIGVAIKVFVLS
jgi:hypothetical protein